MRKQTPKKKVPALPKAAPPLEEAIYAAIDADKARGSNLSFSPLYSFTMFVAQMARGQERQDILNALPPRPKGKSKEWIEGFDAAIVEVMRLLVTRSMV